MMEQASRARVWRFLSAFLRDEAGGDQLAVLANKEALSAFARAGEANADLREAARLFGDFLGDGDMTAKARELAYEYADIFLNAGANPVFPYESVHVTGTPLVMQKPVFELRKAYRAAGVRKNPAYKDLEEHIAVELEFLAWLLENDKVEAYAGFFPGFAIWAAAFAEQLQECARSDFYKALALTLKAMLGDADGRLAKTLAPAMEAMPGLTAPAWVTLAEGADEPQPDRQVPTHCYTCGAQCGMVAKLTDGVFTGAQGLPGDPKSAGRLCPKGGSSPKHLYSAYRLKAPLVREGDRFRKASWEEALARTAEGIKRVEPGKLAYFRGNDFCNWIHEALFDSLGCPKGTHRTMCDNSNRMANEHNLSDKRPWMNYQESDYILHFGINELTSSYGQRKTAEFKDALKRGAKLVVVDPRKSDTAAKAAEWIPITPGADGAMAMAMCWVIVSEGLYDKDFVENWTTGFEEFRKRLMGEEDGQARTPEWASEICGVPAETIVRVAREFAQAKAKGAISWTGLAQTPNAHWATAAIQALNGLCGTFDAPGGPSLPFKRKLKSAWTADQEKPPKAPAPKVDSFGLWSGWSPALFEAQVDAGKIKGMVMYWGDPVLTWGNSASVARGVDKLEFLAAIEAFMCNTALKADVILPDATWLEQAQVKPDWLYEAFIGYFAEVVPPMYDTRPMWRVTKDLAVELGLGRYFPWDDVEDALRNQMAGTPWSYDELKEKGFLLTDPAEYYKYRAWGSLNPPEGYGSSGKSRTGKYNFVNPVSVEKGDVDPLPDYKAIDARFRPDADYPFVFGNFRLFQHEHCSTFNNFQLMKLKPSNTLTMNDEDARELGLTAGDLVRVTSPWGSCDIKVEPTPDMRRGVLGAAGGYGHLRGLEGDPKYPGFGGVNMPGSLMPPNTVEPTGGTPFLKYIKTRVDKL